MKPIFNLSQTFSTIMTRSGRTLEGQWKLEPTSGMFRQSFAVERDTGCIVPMDAIECLIPNGSALPADFVVPPAGEENPS